MTASTPATVGRRLPWLLLAGHVSLILFSTLALCTFLSPSAPPATVAWLNTEPNKTIAFWGWKLSGPLYVLLGAAAMLAHATGALTLRRAAILFAVCSTIALGSELLGTSTGFPFGPYRYTQLLGYRILGLVPFPIPISWTYMIYASLAIVSRLFAPGDDSRTKWRWALLGGLILTAWDVSMDPAMVKTFHWIWGVKGFFYGMPLTNWFGWYLTGVVVSRVMLEFAAPSAFTRIGSSPFPYILYAVNGVMPIALCLRDGLWWAAVLGSIAMLLPLALAGRSFLSAPQAVALAESRVA